ncbi:RNA polymerase sigma factor [Pseudotamlana agarivorans]|uniref:RNA polymerase sigma factor n=1 Tax=Pseudotamlana agarivorans TaxID=481183 RepID=UPI00082D476F|nr:RNA polymerase sigma factor [Tamlana agarivorans]
MTENELFFKKLFNETHAKAFNFIKALSRDENIAYEVVQICFIKIWGNIDKFKQHPNPKALVFVSVKNTFLDEVRKQNRVNSLLTSMEDHKYLDITLPDTSEDHSSFSDTLKAVQLSLEKLPEHIQHIYKLYQFEEFTPTEIAKNLKLSVTTIRENIETAKTMLRRDLKKFRN